MLRVSEFVSSRLSFYDCLLSSITLLAAFQSSIPQSYVGEFVSFCLCSHPWSIDQISGDHGRLHRDRSRRLQMSPPPPRAEQHSREFSACSLARVDFFGCYESYKEQAAIVSSQAAPSRRKKQGGTHVESMDETSWTNKKNAGVIDDARRLFHP